MEKAYKSEVVSQVSGNLSRSRVFFLAEFRGLKIPDLDELRKRLRKTAAEFKVVKNTLVLRAMQQAELPKLDEFCTGTTGIVFGYENEANELSKLLLTYAKEYPFFKIKSAVMDKQVLSNAQIVQLSTLPAKKVLLGQTIGTFKSILTRLVSDLQGPLRKTVYLVSEIKNKQTESN